MTKLTARQYKIKGDWTTDGYLEDLAPKYAHITLDGDAAYYSDDYDMGDRTPLAVDVDGAVGPEGARGRFLPDDGELKRIGWPT